MDIYDRLLTNILKYANSEYYENLEKTKEKIRDDYNLIKSSKNPLDKIFCKHIKKELGKIYLQKR